MFYLSYENFRKFKNSDAVEFEKLHRSTIRHMNSQDYSKKQIDLWSKRVSADRFRKSAKKNTRFIAVEKEKIIDFVDYRNDELMGLYIHKDHMGKDVRKKLLQRLENHAYKNGIGTMKCISTITAHKF